MGDPTGFKSTPDHYDGEREVIDLIRDFMSDREFSMFCVGNMIKYNERAGKKGEKDVDLAKAQWYLEMYRHVVFGSPDPRSTREGYIPYERQDKQNRLFAVKNDIYHPVSQSLFNRVFKVRDA